MRGVGVLSDLLDPVRAYDALSPYKAVCRRRWSALAHRGPPEAELVATDRGNETGPPHGEVNWVEDLAVRLKLDLTIRPRGRCARA